MGRAQDVLANADLGLAEWPDPAAEFAVVAGKKSPRLHTDPKCPALRRASAVTTLTRTWTQAVPDLHQCPGWDAPTTDVGYMRYEMTEWLQRDIARAADRVDYRPMWPGELAEMFTRLEYFDVTVSDPGARTCIARACDLLHAITAIAVEGNYPVEGRLLASAGVLLTPNGVNVPRTRLLTDIHLTGQARAVRAGWEALCEHLAEGATAARAACLEVWATVSLQEPMFRQLRLVHVVPNGRHDVGLDDLLEGWRALFIAEATALADYWLEVLHREVASYAGLPPLHISGPGAHHLQGVWPAIPTDALTVEVPVVVALSVGGYDPLRTLTPSPAWPQSLLTLAADLADEHTITWAEALNTAAAVAA